MLLIGITGKARSGKDTLAEAFTRRGYKRMAFADALKEVTALLANEPSHLYFQEASKEEFTEALGMTRREALQKVGSSMRKEIGTQVWVDRVLRQFICEGQRHPTVISDVRYDNEAEAIIAAGGMVVEVVRPGNQGLTGRAAAHESEKGVRGSLVSVEIINDGTVGDLWAEARKLMVFTDLQEARRADS